MLSLGLVLSTIPYGCAPQSDYLRDLLTNDTAYLRDVHDDEGACPVEWLHTRHLAEGDRVTVVQVQVLVVDTLQGKVDRRRSGAAVQLGYCT